MQRRGIVSLGFRESGRESREGNQFYRKVPAFW